MEQCRYIMLESKLGERICYGIAAVIDYDGLSVILESYVDLYTDRTIIANFVERCNAHKLSLLHISETVDDFLANL